VKRFPPFPFLSKERNGTTAHVERTFRRYLECGIFAHGFAREYSAHAVEIPILSAHGLGIEQAGRQAAKK